MSQEIVESAVPEGGGPAGPDRPGEADWGQASELLRGRGRALIEHAAHYSLCREDAEDAFQRAAEKLLTRAPRMSRFQAYGWMKTVVRNEALSLRRQRQRILNVPEEHERHAQMFGDLDWVSLLPAGEPGPDEQVEVRERIARAHEALRRLKTDERRAMGLLGKGYSYAEIQELTGWTYTKVNRCLAEGRQRFKDLLALGASGDRCAEIEPSLMRLCDGELDGAERDEVGAHLEVCGACRSALATFRAAPQAAAAMSPAVPFAGITDRAGEIAAAVQSRLPGRTGAGEVLAAQLAGGGGPMRGNGMAMLAKLAVLCVGAGGSAAACVATGVTPAPVLAGADRLAQKDEGQREPAPGIAPSDPGPAVPVAPAAPAPPPAPELSGGGESDSPGPGESAPPPEPEPAAPPPTPTESEFSPEAAGTPVTTAPPASSGEASSSSGSSGGGSSTGGGGDSAPVEGTMPRVGGGGEFGP